MELKVKALVKAIEVAEKVFLAEDKTGWCSSFTSSNNYTIESNDISLKKSWDKNNYFKLDSISPEPEIGITYLSGVVYSPQNPLKYDVVLGHYDINTFSFSFVVLEPPIKNYRELFDNFLKGRLNEEIKKGLNAIGEDLFNMVNLTLPPNFGSYV